MTLLIGREQSPNTAAEVFSYHRHRGDSALSDCFAKRVAIAFKSYMFYLVKGAFIGQPFMCVIGRVARLKHDDMLLTFFSAAKLVTDHRYTDDRCARASADAYHTKKIFLVCHTPYSALCSARACSIESYISSGILHSSARSMRLLFLAFFKQESLWQM